MTTYRKIVWQQYRKHPLGVFALFIVALFAVTGVYAPFLASSKPIFVIYDGTWYFPLFRYLLYQGFFTKRMDLFFNLFMFIFPWILLSLFIRKPFGKYIGFSALSIQCLLFLYLIFNPMKDPASDVLLTRKRMERLNQIEFPAWNFELEHMNSYAKLNLIIGYRLSKQHHETLKLFEKKYFQSTNDETLPTHWQMKQTHEETLLSSVNKERVQKMMERNEWLEKENQKISYLIMPLIRPFHWEEDAGGNSSLNQLIPWWELTRIHHKDLTAALIFGIRISMVVGIVSIGLALGIGVPIGALAGYFGGKFDIFASRLIEIWESMPVLFMLLLIVAILQSKSIFLVITVIGIFGWTGFCRFTRGEFFKQRNLPYIEACHAMGFPSTRIMFSHILPNAIPPLLTLMPFAVMGAITSEAGLSFLGLGEEGSCSWGVLMDEGRKAFPGESYLLWPPAILLTILLIAIAIVGDTLRDALDPKLHIPIETKGF